MSVHIIETAIVKKTNREGGSSGDAFWAGESRAEGHADKNSRRRVTRRSRSAVAWSVSVVSGVCSRLPAARTNKPPIIIAMGRWRRQCVSLAAFRVEKFPVRWGSKSDIKINHSKMRNNVQMIEEEEPGKCCNFWYCVWKVFTCICSHFILISMVVSYCIMGAYTFQVKKSRKLGIHFLCDLKLKL